MAIRPTSQSTSSAQRSRQNSTSPSLNYFQDDWCSHPYIEAMTDESEHVLDSNEAAENIVLNEFDADPLDRNTASLPQLMEVLDLEEHHESIDDQLIVYGTSMRDGIHSRAGDSRRRFIDFVHRLIEQNNLQLTAQQQLLVEDEIVVYADDSRQIENAYPSDLSRFESKSSLTIEDPNEESVMDHQVELLTDLYGDDDLMPSAIDTENKLPLSSRFMDSNGIAKKRQWRLSNSSCVDR